MSKKRATATLAGGSGGDDSSHHEEEFANYVRAIEIMHQLREIFEETLRTESARTRPRSDRIEWLQTEVGRLGALINKLRPSDCEAVAGSIHEFGPILSGRI